MNGKTLKVSCRIVLSIAIVGLTITVLAETKVIPPPLSINAAKIRIEPGKPQELTVEIRNTSPTKTTGKLRIWLEYGVDQKIDIANKTETIDGGQKRELKFSWIPKAELWGCRINAEWKIGDKIVYAYDVFSVTRIENTWAASPIYKMLPTTHMNNAGPRLAKQIAKFRRQGTLAIELFNWQPTHFGGMTPLPDKAWINGMSRSRRTFSKESIHLAEKCVHSHGIAFITYAIICHSGPAGHAWLEKHPEDGLFPTKEAKNPMKPELGSVATANTMRRETLERTLNEYVNVIKEFKFDGIRWDGHPGTPYHPISDNMFRMNGISSTPGFDHNGRPVIAEDPDALNLEIDEYTQKVFHKVFPNFLFGYNYSGFGTAKYSPRYMLNPRSFLSTCAGNMVLDEKQMNAGRDRSGVPSQIFCRTWPTVRKFTINTADIVRSLGGFPYRGPIYDAKNPGFQKVCYSTLFASATHPVSAGDIPSNWGLFALRHNQLLFHPSLIRARDFHFSVPVQVISTGAFAPIYKDYIYSLYTAGRYRQLVHILNNPGGDEINVKRQREITWPMKDVSVTMGLPLGLKWKAMKFYALSPDFNDWRKELKPIFSKAGVQITLPEFNYWCIVVMDVPVNEETIIWDKNADPWMIDVEQDPTKSRKKHD